MLTPGVICCVTHTLPLPALHPAYANISMLLVRWLASAPHCCPLALHAGWVQYVVLDEADKMLGLGFAPQIGALKALLLPPEGAAKAEDKTGSKTQQKQRVQVRGFKSAWYCCMHLSALACKLACPSPCPSPT